MKRRTALLAVAAVIAALASSALPTKTVLLWNSTASAPTGLYLLRKPTGLRVGDRVVVDPPARLRPLLAKRGYLPLGVPLLKEVAALPGQTICRLGLAISIDGEPVGAALARDRIGRALPDWQGCRRLNANEIFVLNPRSHSSFDGRYFGPVSHDAIVAAARPVWTDEQGTGDREWFATPPKSTR